jgi:hypothetical protein
MVEARRRRRMAEALAQQAYTPQDVGVAPIPAAAPLVQGLQAFLSARAARKADEAEEKAAAEVTRTGEQIAGRLAGGAPVRSLAPADASGLQEVAVTSEYQRSPDDAMRVAMTSPGTAAVKGNPMLAAMLAQQMDKPEKRLQVGAVDPSKFTPESIAAAMQSNNPSLLKPVAGGEDSRIGKPSPGDFTPASLAQFNQTGDYSVLVPTKRAGTSVNITNRYGSPVAAEDMQGNPMLIQPSATGGAPSIMQGVRPAKAKSTATVAEQTTAWNVSRIINAARDIEAATAAEPSAIKPSMREAAAGIIGEEAAGASRSGQRQIVAGAQADLLDSMITLATGAAYTQEQMIAARKAYIPSLTDKPETIAAKKNRLAGLIPAAKTRSGAAWTPELDKAAQTLLNSMSPAAPKAPTPSGGWGKAQQVR